MKIYIRMSHKCHQLYSQCNASYTRNDFPTFPYDIYAIWYTYMHISNTRKKEENVYNPITKDSNYLLHWVHNWFM